jgi:23S rRNA (cytosine1962-C5)-methyltransferase
MNDWKSLLEKAFRLPARSRAIPSGVPLRLFDGASEGIGRSSSVLIDRFGEWVWITDRTELEAPLDPVAIQQIQEACSTLGVQGGVLLERPKSQLPATSTLAFGQVPEGVIVVSENHSQELKMRIQLLGARHPGLFIDHSPLRSWMISQAGGQKVLNTFSYTGSLSVAAGLGGAAQVSTLDLSQKTIDEAKKNWELNALASEADWFADDFFEFAIRQKKKQRTWNWVILDPPSFSRSKRGTFSTQKDLVRLHSAALSLIAPGGRLITSINSANIAAAQFDRQVQEAARSSGRRLRILDHIRLPDWIPTRPGEAPYLKGLIAEVSE